jgi:hypothetical protein
VKHAGAQYNIPTSLPSPSLDLFSTHHHLTETHQHIPNGLNPTGSYMQRTDVCTHTWNLTTQNLGLWPTSSSYINYEVKNSVII